MSTSQPTSLEISEVKDIEISAYKNCLEKKSEPISINTLLNLLQTGKGFKERVLKIRNSKSRIEIDEIKKQLPAVTLSGLFDGERKTDKIITHSGFIQIDIDKPKGRDQLKEKLKSDEFSFAVFDSPTQTGLKVIVRIQPNVKTHLQSFESLEKYYQQHYNAKIDEKCKDITRLMFLSFDEHIFINTDSAIWLPPINDKQSFENMLKWLQQTKGQSYTEGNRNDFIYKLSAACYRVGVNESYTIAECLKRFQNETIGQKEIESTIKSAYHSNISPQHPNGLKTPLNAKIKQSNGVNGKEKNYSALARVECYIKSKYELRRNEVTLDVEFRKVGCSDPFKVLIENNLYRELLLQSISISNSKLTSLLGSDFVESYNPFKEYFENLETWDESKDPDYINKLTSYVPVKDIERFKVQFKKMFVRCIACALNDSVFNKQAFIFIHSQQNSGKSTFCRWLCPSDLEAYQTENIRIDKDGLIALTENFLINLDELAILSRSEINQLKSIFSLPTVKVRAPYDRKQIAKPRRANFIGSTNKDEFLTDETGSVRFVCIELIDKLNFNYKLEMKIDDVWRQAYSLYKKDFHYELTLDEVAENEKANKKYQVESQEIQMIQQTYQPAVKTDPNAEFLNATEILKELNAGNIFLKLNTQSIGKALKHLGFIQDCRYNEKTGYTTKGYYVKKIQT